MPAFTSECSVCERKMQPSVAPLPVCLECKRRSICVQCAGPVSRNSAFCSSRCLAEWQTSKQVEVHVEKR
jgi:hypothetical protein